MLATVGVHAVTSYSVAMRKAEMGVRLALGAEQSTIVRSMVRQALQPVALGLLAGMVGGALGAIALTNRLPVGDPARRSWCDPAADDAAARRRHRRGASDDAHRRQA